jgi:hypothetical protein
VHDCTARLQDTWTKILFSYYSNINLASWLEWDTPFPKVFKHKLIVHKQDTKTIKVKTCQQNRFRKDIKIAYVIGATLDLNSILSHWEVYFSLLFALSLQWLLHKRAYQNVKKDGRDTWHKSRRRWPITDSINFILIINNDYVPFRNYWSPELLEMKTFSHWNIFDKT